MDVNQLSVDLEDEDTDLDVLHTPVPAIQAEGNVDAVIVQTNQGRTVIVRGASPELAAKLKLKRPSRCSSMEIDQPF